MRILTMRKFAIVFGIPRDLWIFLAKHRTRVLTTVTFGIHRSFSLRKRVCKNRDKKSITNEVTLPFEIFAPFPLCHKMGRIGHITPYENRFALPRVTSLVKRYSRRKCALKLKFKVLLFTSTYCF